MNISCIHVYVCVALYPSMYVHISVYYYNIYIYMCIS